ncbi:hypothetical protein BCR35DRAFT_288551 [Leucosporidium creatinivorum]|uniref:ZZ-type domain-containing protein n=1 Tax=Leucosporidium creatinivorum TaxID=106004 RepID=A0A1Y2FXL9_9BASI|nr:hypothetical protein BCR35DRAFT_288551 [Leucosporidium creatinivorum]
MASPSTSPNHSFVFKLKHKSATGKEESRRYGFSGDLRHPAVFTGLYDRTAQVFNLSRADFSLATTDNLGRQVRLQGYDSFLEHVCEPTLSPKGQRIAKLDDKKRIVLVFHVVKEELPEPVEEDQSVPLSAPHTLVGNDEVTAQEDVEAANWDKETAEALARSQETFNAEQEAREKGRKAYEEVKAAEEARRLAAATAVDSTPLVDVSTPFESANVQATSLAGPPAPPAVPLSAFRPFHPYHQHPHHHHHHQQQGTSGPAALGGPFHHHHLPPHAHAHAHSHSVSANSHGHHHEAHKSHDGLTASRLAVMEKRIELRRQMQERLQSQSRPSPAEATVVIPAEVSARDGYHPAYSTASTEIAQEQQQTSSSVVNPPDSPIAETWSGVKGMLKTFVRDLNRHLAENFGDDAAGFELSLPGEGEEKVEQPKVAEVKRDVKVEEPEEKVVHRACFCDRCLKTIVGVRHKCTGCSNYDLCTPCLEGREAFHNTQHVFARIARPGAMPVVDAVPVKKDPAPAPAVAQEEEPVFIEVHPATCDACDKTIKGVRHKCLECPDYDLCASCLDSVGSVVHPLHNFVPIASPRVLRIRAQPGAHAIHANIICDACDASPIIGVRYRCVEPECGDQFDMCERCEAEPIPRHPRSHRLLKIREPVTGGERATKERMERARKIGGAVGAGQEGDAVPLASLGGGIERILKSLGVGAPSTAEKGTSTEEQQQGLPSWATLLQGPGNDRTIVIDVDVDAKEQTTVGEKVQLGQAPYDVDTLVREAEKEGVEEEQPEPEEEVAVADEDERAVQTAVEEEEEVAPVPVDNSLRASFVADVTLTDGSVVPSGGEFNKVWLVRNSGTLAWPQGTVLVNVGGFSNLVAGEAGVKQFEVPQAEPGEAVEIQCELKAAEENGRYMDFWRLEAPNGELFGDRFWVEIFVESDDALLRNSGSSLNSSFVAPSMHASGKLQGPSTTATGTDAAPTVSSVVAPSVKSESIEGTSEFESVKADVEDEDEGSSEEEMSDEDTSSEEESEESEEEIEEDEEFVVLTGSEEGESSSEDEEWRA